MNVDMQCVSIKPPTNYMELPPSSTYTYPPHIFFIRSLFLHDIHLFIHLLLMELSRHVFPDDEFLPKRVKRNIYDS